MIMDFPKIFVVNLIRSIERRKDIESKFNYYKIPFEIFQATDGSQLSLQELMEIQSNASFFKQKYGREMNEGEIGCALSHINLYKKIVSEEISYAIILEDDIEFDKRFEHFVTSSPKIKKLLQHFDLILLGYAAADLNYRKPGKCSVWKKIKLDETIKVGVPVNRCWGTIGYLISKEGARKLLLNGESPQMQADYLTSNSPNWGVKLGLIMHQLIWPNEEVKDSIIGKRIFDENSSFDSLNKTAEKSVIKKILLNINKLFPTKPLYYIVRKRVMSYQKTLKKLWDKVNPKQYGYVEKI
jgi:glycosyl transferase family 25